MKKVSGSNNYSEKGKHMNRLESYSKRLMWLFVAFLLAAFTAGCGNWNGGSSAATPSVSSTTPVDGATGVAINRKLAAIFSEAMDPATITTATFTVTGPGTTPVPGAVSYVGTTATFTPTTNLPASTLFTATISTGAKNPAGTALAGNYVWSFTTGANLDTTAPTVTSTGAPNGATGLPINRSATAIFSEPMDPATISATTFTLTGPGGTPVPATVTYVGVTATLKPTTDLAPNTLYTGTITTGSKDLAGNALAANYVWSWATAAGPDTTAPTVSSTIPANAATGVPINQKISAIFSEQMDPLTITTATFTMTKPALLGVTQTPVTGTVAYVGVTGTFTPSAPLAYNTTYTATISTGSKDMAGNTLAANYVWSFTTGAAADTTIPTVSSTVPANLATGVVIGGDISATFSEAMDPLTITNVTFTLQQGTTPVAGAVTYVGVTATFNPTGNLAANTTYTATIGTGAKDLAGNALATNYAWSFTTGAATDTTAPTVSSTVPANLATGVPLNQKINATFSEAMDPLTVTNITYTLKQGTTPVPSTVAYVGVTATLTPAAPLTYSTTYTATISTGARDLAGNALATDYVWTFTTGAAADTTPPTVTSTVPVNLATGVAIGDNITATFSEAMDPLTITNTTFTLKQGTTPVSGAVTYVGTTATFNPTSDLAFSTTYTATITGGTTGAKDLAGNALATDYVWSFTTASAVVGGLAPGAIPLGSAGTFGIMATSAITNTGLSVINGDVSLDPGTSMTGFPPGVVNGAIHINDTVSAQARADLLAAYNTAKALPPGTTVSAGADLGALYPTSIPPGTYTSGSTMLISTPLTLNAGGNTNAVWVFQIGSSLTTGASVILANGAQAKNVFWVPTSDATIGVGTIFYGTIVAGRDVTGKTGSVINGRILAGAILAGTIALDTNTVNVPAP
jgi:hypothetical protein